MISWEEIRERFQVSGSFDLKIERIFNMRRINKMK